MCASCALVLRGIWQTSTRRFSRSPRPSGGRVARKAALLPRRRIYGTITRDLARQLAARVFSKAFSQADAYGVLCRLCPPDDSASQGARQRDGRAGFGCSRTLETVDRGSPVRPDHDRNMCPLHGGARNVGNGRINDEKDGHSPAIHPGPRRADRSQAEKRGRNYCKSPVYRASRWDAARAGASIHAWRNRTSYRGLSADKTYVGHPPSRSAPMVGVVDQIRMAHRVTENEPSERPMVMGDRRRVAGDPGGRVQAKKGRTASVFVAGGPPGCGASEDAGRRPYFRMERLAVVFSKVLVHAHQSHATRTATWPESHPPGHAYMACGTESPRIAISGGTSKTRRFRGFLCATERRNRAFGIHACPEGMGSLKHTTTRSPVLSAWTVQATGRGRAVWCCPGRDS